MEKANVNDYLRKNVLVKVDRQLMTRHPKHDFIYMLNYDFISNIITRNDEIYIYNFVCYI